MINNTNNNKVFFYILIGFIAFISFKVVAPYISIIVLALIISIIFNPVYVFFYRLFRNNSMAASLMSVLIVLFTFLVPLMIIGAVFAAQTVTFYNDINKKIDNKEITIEKSVTELNEFIDKVPYAREQELTEEQINKFVKDNIQPAVNYLKDAAIGVGKSIVDFIPKLIVFIFFLVGIFPNQLKIIEFIKKISPFDNRIDDIYINRVIAMATSMVKGTLVIAIIQGLISGGLLWIAGVDYVFFWTLMSIFLSIIPIGSGIVVMPIGLIMILTGQVWQGALLILGHLIVTTNIDNILRPRLVSKDAELHPLLVLVGILGGIQYFNFFGFIYGPVIMIFLMTTLEVYVRYYKNNTHDDQLHAFNELNNAEAVK